MIDTSGSMTDEMITMAYSEIHGAVEMFNGKFKGYLGFFDTVVYEPIEFKSISDLKKIIPYGGGGTNFHIIFDYINKMEDKPSLVIILTDGFATFPDESYTGGIPVLWLLTTKIVMPPFGKIARLETH
jgi:predicted metal-dependent peptidase